MVYEYFMIEAYSIKQNKTIKYIFLDWEKLNDCIDQLYAEGYSLNPIDELGNNILNYIDTMDDIIETWKPWGYEIIK